MFRFALKEKYGFLFVFFFSPSYLPRWMQHWSDAASVPQRLYDENQVMEHRWLLGFYSSVSTEL